MIASYQAKFGPIPVEESVRLLRVDKLSDEDTAMLATRLETLVGVIGALGEEAREAGGSVH